MTPVLYDASSWCWWHYIAWVASIVIGIEMLEFSLRFLAKTSIPKIPITGPHHDTLGWTDISYIVFNKLTAPLFIYHMVKFCYNSNEVTWSDNPFIILLNIIVAIPALFVVYEFFYVFFHRGLHHPSIYKYVHKHHHQQNAPTRGYTDAINTHPFEYVTGQYNHLFAVYILCRVMPVHVLSVAGFMSIGAMMAGLNHTRLDLGLGFVYQVKHHDAHHKFVNVNYCQYIVLWDWLLGSYKESRDAPRKEAPRKEARKESPGRKNTPRKETTRKQDKKRRVFTQKTNS